MRCFGPRPCSGIDSTIIILNPPRRLGRLGHRRTRGFLLIPPAGACRQCPLLKIFLARFGRRSRNRFAPDGLEYYRDDKLYHGCSVVMSYSRLIFSTMSLLKREIAQKPSAFTGELLGRFSSSTSPTWRNLTISSRRTRCCRLSWGEQPPKCARFSFLELVASIAPFARACTWQRAHVTCARCDASGPGVFCL